MKKTAVIVAGGSGSRMNADIPKQFMMLHDKPLICHTISSFLQADPQFSLIIVLPASHIDASKTLLQQYFPDNQFLITAGGNSRFESVRNGLSLIEEPCIVFVHDAVRCLLTPHLIDNAYQNALLHGTAIPVVECKDSVRFVEENGNQSIDRSRVKLVQTPQTFKSDILLPAFEQPYQSQFTDEATVVEAMGVAVHLFEGDVNNIKVTYPSDLQMASMILQTNLDNSNAH